MKRETRDEVKCFSQLLSALPLPKSFTTEQSTVDASLFVLFSFVFDIMITLPNYQISAS